MYQSNHDAAMAPAMLAGLPATLAEPVQKQVRRTLEVAAGGKGPTVDGKLEDWPTTETAWARIDPRTTASLWITPERIHAAFRTGDPKLLAPTRRSSRWSSGWSRWHRPCKSILNIH